jgi:hypothetical protein
MPRTYDHHNANSENVFGHEQKTAESVNISPVSLIFFELHDRRGILNKRKLATKRSVDFQHADMMAVTSQQVTEDCRLDL